MFRSTDHLDSVVNSIRDNLLALEELRAPIEAYWNSRAQPWDDLDLRTAVGWYHWHLLQAHKAVDDVADDKDLDAAIYFFAPVFEASPTARAPLALRELYWTDCLGSLAQQDDYASMISFLERTIESVWADTSARRWLSFQLARSIWLAEDSHPTGPSLRKLDEALRFALDGFESDEPEYVEASGMLGRTTFLAYTESVAGADRPNVDLLDESITLSLQSLNQSAGDQIIALGDVVEALRVRFNLLNQPSDLELAHDAAVIACERTRGQPLETKALEILNEVDLWWAASGGDASLIDAAVATIEAVADLDSERTAETLGNISKNLLDAYRLLRLDRCLEGAVLAGKRGLRICQESHRPPPPHLVANLSAALQMELGDDDLTEVVELLANLQVWADQDLDPETRAGLLNERAGLHLEVFTRNASLTNLTFAIELIEKGGQLVEGNVGLAALFSNNLCNALLQRYIHSPISLTSDIQRAKAAGHAATAHDHFRFPLEYVSALTTYCRALQWSAEFEEAEDVVKGITLAQRALSLAERHKGETSNIHHVLSNLLRIRYRQAHLSAALDQAINHGRRAIETASADSGNLLVNMANLLYARFSLKGEDEDWDSAMQALEAVDALAAELPSVKIDANRLLAEHAAAAHRWDLAAQALSRAIGLLPLMLPRQSHLSTKEDLLRSLEGLPSFAVEAWLQCGDELQALSCVERARNVIIGQLLDTQTEVTQLAASEPALAEELQSLLDSTLPLDTDGDPAIFLKKQEWSRNLESLVSTIREARPEFADFFRMPSATDLLAKLESTEAVIMLNLGRSRADALICRSQGVTIVRLPPEVLTGLGPLLERFLSFAGSIGRFPRGSLKAQEADEGLGGVIRWLERNITLPIIQVLSASNAPQLKRINWCSSGKLALLPLHAAWPALSDGSNEPILHATISSMRALHHARERASFSAADSNFLLVSAAEVPGALPLPGVEDVYDLLSRSFPALDHLVSSQSNTTQATANSNDVLVALSTHPWCHFYCHGSYDASDPSQSSLVLADHPTAPLTASRIATARLKLGELAFLGVCSTAVTGTSLADEQLHLASAFQVAGFRRVIGSLWTVWSDDVYTLSRTFYGRLLDSSTFPDASFAVVALNLAVQSLRVRYPAQPSRWAGFVYSGA